MILLAELSFVTASILNFQLRDRKHGGAYCNHCEVIIPSMKYPTKIKNHVTR